MGILRFFSDPQHKGSNISGQFRSVFCKKIRSSKKHFVKNSLCRRATFINLAKITLGVCDISDLDFSMSGVMRSPLLLASLSEGPGIRDPKTTSTLLNYVLGLLTVRAEIIKSGPKKP